ncbi:MAG: hypothetical protein ACI8W8_004652 [Rhodothermales bacterium]
MARKRPDPLELKLKHLRDIREGNDFSDSIQVELRRHLRDSHNYVASQAARIIARERLPEFEDDLALTFERFMENPVESDPGSKAKEAAIAALRELGCMAAVPYIRAIRHIQPEAAWGPPVDTAVSLRVNAAHALVECGYHDADLHLLDLLADKEPICRSAAAEALGRLATETAELLLRQKANFGDPEPEVMDATLSALVAANPLRSLEFVARFLRGTPAAANSAAIAIAEARSVAAFEILAAHWEQCFAASEREQLCFAIALTRIEPAFDFLLEQIRDGHVRIATAVIKALGMYSGDAKIRARVHDAASQRSDLRPLLLAEHFPA